MEALFLIIAIVSVVIGVLVYQNKQYKKTAYYQVTKNPYSSIKYDRGKYGEYLTYKNLQCLEKGGGKFLFNIYIPKTNDETSEIDVLLICPKGLFIFESKNYSGWIFGNETQKNWTQTLPQGKGYPSRKERFYNPIMQNASHIRHLKRIVAENVPMRSVIVFSDECTLKNVTVKSGDVSVINSCRLLSAVTQICSQTQTDLLTQLEINDMYDNLYPYTQIGYEVRERHKNNIQK